MTELEYQILLAEIKNELKKYKSFREILSEILRDSNLAMNRLANEIGITKGRLSQFLNYQSNDPNPRADTIMKILAYTTKYTPEDLLASLSETNYVVIILNRKKTGKTEIDRILDDLKLSPLDKSLVKKKE